MNEKGEMRCGTEGVMSMGGMVAMERMGDRANIQVLVA